VLNYFIVCFVQVVELGAICLLKQIQSNLIIVNQKFQVAFVFTIPQRNAFQKYKKFHLCWILDSSFAKNVFHQDHPGFISVKI
jgi:hypothetical protein